MSETTGWQPIETVPRDKTVDVWVADTFGDGVRWTDVKVHGDLPFSLLAWRTNDAGQLESTEYWPHENGQYLAAWLPVPSPPTTIERTEA
jgi:hypothetical protein